MPLTHACRGSGAKALPGRAFTLVELLVVLAVIAILIAMLMPALKKAKLAADGAKCANNVRTIMTAFLMFAQDHKNQLPGNKHDSDDRRLRGAPRHTEEWKTDWLMGRVSTDIRNAPQKGTIWKYIRKKEVYSCPTEEANLGMTGMAAGTNQRFDYAFFGSFAGANLSKIKGTCTFRDNYTGKESTHPTPVIVQEHPRWINGSNLEGGHSFPDQMASAHNKGSYYGSIDGSVHFFIEREDPTLPAAAQRNGASKSWFSIGPTSGRRVTIGEDLMWGEWQGK